MCICAGTEKGAVYEEGNTTEAEEAQSQAVSSRKPRRSDALLASAATIWDKGWGALVPNLNSSLSKFCQARLASSKYLQRKKEYRYACPEALLQVQKSFSANSPIKAYCRNLEASRKKTSSTEHFVLKYGFSYLPTTEYV